jgi:hypothetical protein
VPCDHSPGIYAFHLIEHDGEDLRNLPLLDRKAALARLLREQQCRGSAMKSDIDAFRRQRTVRCCDRDLAIGAGDCGGGGPEPLERMYCPIACSLVISPIICA